MYMNIIKIIVSIFVLALLSAGVLYGIKVSTTTSNQESIVINQEEIEGLSEGVLMRYVSENESEAQVEYIGDMAVVTILGSQYQNIITDRTISASGARYENKDNGLAVWEKAPEITITQDDEVIFVGKTFESVVLADLTTGIWEWQGTTLNNKAPNQEITKPQKPNTFTLKFDTNGNVSGTTDCNSFGGTYTLDGLQITFGPFMSTLMYCEGSQEQEFISMIKDGSLSYSQDGISITHEYIVSFTKQK